MNEIKIPETYNYIGCFLTFACTLNCSYCINRFEEGKFKKSIISGKEWVEGLNRIVGRPDLPITLQGGEPTMHPDFYYIINNLKKDLSIDIITNLQFDVDEFIEKVNPERLKREAPYASIRVSYHPEKMSRFDTRNTVLKLLNHGYSVGVWGVLHPEYKDNILETQEMFKSVGIDFRTKEFLGEYKGKLYGTYKYKEACEKKFWKLAMCKTTELIIGTGGDIYRCHSDLYEWRLSIGHILDCDFQIEDRFRECAFFGHCNPCDVKVKTNRFQEDGHTSVEIRK